MKTALSIAGSDSSGGAGIQADLKTMTMNGVYAMSAITALTAQNTTGVSAILDVTPHFLQQQIDAVFTDIPPDAVKIGMVSSAPLIQTIARCLRTYQAANIYPVHDTPDRKSVVSCTAQYMTRQIGRACHVERPST